MVPGGAYLQLVARAPFHGLAAVRRVQRENRAGRGDAFPSHPDPNAADRLLILAPHPDDEALALGGLLHRAAAAGARVTVAFLTSGDGYPSAAYRESRRPRSLAEACLALGETRREEALASLNELGLPPEAARFLGYPDGCLADLCFTHWLLERPFRSPFTGAEAVPYPLAHRPGAPYCGAALLEDVAALLAEERPTRVYAPHPFDDHGDHWAAWCVLCGALAGLAGPPPALQAYLVHRGAWPAPQAPREQLPLAPPAHLAAQAWEALPLTQPERAAKRRALACHRSQQRGMGRFLRSFLRASELVGGELPPEREGERRRWLLPRERGPRRVLVPGAELVGVEVRRASGKLLADFEFGAPPGRGVTLQAAFHPLAPPGPPLLLRWRGEWDFPGAEGEVEGRRLRLQVAHPIFHGEGPLLLTLWTRLGRIRVERCAFSF